MRRRQKRDPEIDVLLDLDEQVFVVEPEGKFLSDSRSGALIPHPSGRLA